MAQNNNLMPSSLDRHISTTEQDAFGHRHFAYALRSLIESEKHAPPFSIGLLGGWGTGKSTIKGLYIRDLKDDAQKNSSARTRSDLFHIITFNAWRFGGRDQDIKRALLRQVFLELGGNEENLHDRLFRQISETYEQPKGLFQYTGEILKAWAMPIPAFVLSLLLLLALLYLMLWLLPLQNDLSRSIVVLAFTWAYSYLLKQIKSPPVASHRPLTRIDLPSTTAEQYEELLLDQIAKFKSGQCTTPDGKKGKECERLIVFVDDLDRLSAEEMVLGLDAVRTFMEIPESRLPKGLGLVFVISCDEAKVAHALAERRRQGDMPGAVFSQSDARRYLDRIFQFRIEIPPFPRHDMRQYAIKQLNDLPDLGADLRARGVPIETLVDRMIHVGVHDPRNALQIVNAFVQSWWLAKKRETEELGTGRPGGLHEGAVTLHPISLGALSAIKVNFPDFYQDLQNDPALLNRMTDVLVRGKLITDQPLTTQQLLTERYFRRRDSQGDASFELCPEHRPLRQFLASLIGLRWPTSLQSLLLLSEDPITRNFGEKATTIYAAFVSGDTQGVLEGFGRHIDAASLKKEEARLLYQMAEELQRESLARRTNASRVIADLADRLPEETAYLLLGSLCRELEGSADLRSQLGIQKINKVLNTAQADDQRTVASRLIEDVLTIEEDVRLRLETMEPPNLEEAIAFTRGTVSLVLPIRRDHGLDPAADRQLLAWLVNRTVRIGGKYYQFPFEELNRWVSDHEDDLLPALADRYTDLLVSELEGEIEPRFDTSSAINMARKVFANLWDAGEYTRPILWKSLTQYVALKQPEASQTAWELMADHVSSPDAIQITKFLANFIDRISHETDNTEWPHELVETAGQKLLFFVRKRIADIDTGTLHAISDLAILWSQNEDTSSLSCDIVKELLGAHVLESRKVFDNWAERILADLPIDCINLFASLFPTLEPSTKSNAITQLNPIISNDTIEESSGSRYGAFVKAVPEEAWDMEPLKGHLDSLLPQISNRYNNPNSYLNRVFPNVVSVLHHASPKILGQALYNIFEQAKGHPKHYASLHSWMVERWPEASPDLKPYDPAQIFRDGRDFALAQPQSSSKGLLMSLRDMLRRKLVPNDQCTALIEAACATWATKPDEAIDTFTSGYGDLIPEQAANLLDSIDLTNNEQQVLLSRAWSSVAQYQDADKQVRTTNRILEKGVCGPDDEPDRGLRLWFDAQGESSREGLATAIIQVELNDSHRNRLWRQVTRRAAFLGSLFFLDVIPKIAVLSPIEETANSLFADFDLVDSTLGSADNRADLSQHLIQAFQDALTNTVKSHIAGWCKKLNGQASLQKLRPEFLTDEDMSILNSHFPGSTALKKLEKAKKDG